MALKSGKKSWKSARMALISELIELNSCFYHFTQTNFTLFRNSWPNFYAQFYAPLYRPFAINWCASFNRNKITLNSICWCGRIFFQPKQIAKKTVFPRRNCFGSTFCILISIFVIAFNHSVESVLAQIRPNLAHFWASTMGLSVLII